MKAFLKSAEKHSCKCGLGIDFCKNEAGQSFFGFFTENDILEKPEEANYYQLDILSSFLRKSAFFLQKLKNGSDN